LVLIIAVAFGFSTNKLIFALHLSKVPFHHQFIWNYHKDLNKPARSCKFLNPYSAIKELLNSGLNYYGTFFCLWISLNFSQSALDPCLFLKPGVIFIVYVDDGIFISHSLDAIDKCIADLKTASFDLDEEDDYAGYLGISLDKQPNGTIHMLQTGLIDRILDDLGLTGTSRTKSVPAAGPIGPCKDSKSLHVPWNYRSVIGKLMYLANNTRSDIAFANHQCAHF
jgi:Reverse transcriptase (RNA-dependent DNA polymerase)